MKVLIAGGAGYVGSVLVRELLLAGEEVRVLDNLMYTGRSLLPFINASRFEFQTGDICDQSTCQKALQGVDAVVNLAAIVGDPASKRHPELTKAVNYTGSVTLAGMARAQQIGKFIAVSTCSNYGKADVSTYADEGSPLRPVSLYAETKVAMEKHLMEKVDGLDWTVLRFATAFGVSPRMRFDLTVSDFTMTMHTQKKLVIYGEQFWRPYVHIKDIARAIQLVLANPEKTHRQVFNVGATSENYRKLDIVKLVEKCIPDGEVEFVHRDEDPRDYRVSFEKIRNTLGFEVSHTVEDGVREVYSLLESGVISDFDNPEYTNTPPIS